MLVLTRTKSPVVCTNCSDVWIYFRMINALLWRYRVRLLSFQSDFPVITPVGSEDRQVLPQFGRRVGSYVLAEAVMGFRKHKWYPDGCRTAGRTQALELNADAFSHGSACRNTARVLYFYFKSHVCGSVHVQVQYSSLTFDSQWMSLDTILCRTWNWKCFIFVDYKHKYKVLSLNIATLVIHQVSQCPVEFGGSTCLPLGRPRVLSRIICFSQSDILFV